MPERLTPLRELVNVAEMETMARLRLDPSSYAEIAGSDRSAFERITFRPRAMVDTTGLNLSLELFGQKLFAPVLAGPASRLARFHGDAESALVKGAAAAKAAVVLAAESSRPLEHVIREGGAPLFCQVSPGKDPEAVRDRARHAVALGCKAVFLTLSADWTWNDIDQFRKDLGAPLVIKGVMTPAEAKAALERGIDGLVVSSYRRQAAEGMAQAIEMVGPVADAVGGRAPVLVDGSFRRGTDILKALALGARGVLVCRPVLWGLAAYGAEGVQYVLEMLQTELARSMVMIGAVDLNHIVRPMVRIHRRPA